MIENLWNQNPISRANEQLNLMKKQSFDFHLQSRIVNLPTVRRVSMDKMYIFHVYQKSNTNSERNRFIIC